jgi:3-isopropylmalate dehydratase small subunit
LLEGSKDGELVVTVDLESQTVSKSGGERKGGDAAKSEDGTEYGFSYDSFRKHCLLNGLDDIDYILTYSDTIQDFRQGFERPWMRDVNNKTGQTTFRLRLAEDVKRPAGLAPVSEAFERNYAERRFERKEAGEQAGQPEATSRQTAGEGTTKGAAQ